MSNIEKYTNLKNKLMKKYKEEMSILNMIIDTIEKYSEIKDNDSFETIVFKKYLEFENVSDVAKFLNDKGYRVKTKSYIGQRKYIGTDITEILISEKSKLVDKQLKETVYYIHSRNCREVNKYWN